MLMKNKKVKIKQTTKIGEHIPCGYPMSTIRAIWSHKKQKYLYHGKDCMKKFCEPLREHKKNTTDFEKKKVLPWTTKE